MIAKCLLTWAACVCATSGVCVADSIAQISSRIGITPEAVAAVGADGSAESILQNIIEANDKRLSIAALDASIAQATESVAAAMRARQERPLSPATADELNARMNHLRDLQTQLRRAEEELRTVALDDCSPVAAELIANWVASQAYDVPLEFRVLRLDADEWSELEGSWRACRIASKHGRPLHGEHADRVEQVTTDQGVRQARVNLETRLPGVFQVFQQHTTSEE